MAAKNTSRKKTPAKSGSRKAPVKKTTKKKVKKKAVARTGKPKKKVPAPKKRTGTKPVARSKKKTTKVATKKAVVRRKTEKKVARGPVLDLRGLRKQLTINPARVIKKGGVWLPQAAVMSDLRDSSSTVLLVDSTDQDVLLDDALFEVRPAVGAESAAD